MIAQGRQGELMDRIYSAFSAARERSELLLVEGTSVGGTDLDAAIAAAINAPVLLTVNASDKHSSGEILNAAVGAAGPGSLWQPLWLSEWLEAGLGGRLL
jgi:phosphate acetyltransferase